jgi:hypothetical protein
MMRSSLNLFIGLSRRSPETGVSSIMVAAAQGKD